MYTGDNPAAHFMQSLGVAVAVAMMQPCTVQPPRTTSNSSKNPQQARPPSPQTRGRTTRRWVEDSKPKPSPRCLPSLPSCTTVRCARSPVPALKPTGSIWKDRSIRRRKQQLRPGRLYQQVALDRGNCDVSCVMSHARAVMLMLLTSVVLSIRR